VQPWEREALLVALERLQQVQEQLQQLQSSSVVWRSAPPLVTDCVKLSVRLARFELKKLLTKESGSSAPRAHNTSSVSAGK
jgi:hypothetical protein